MNYATKDGYVVQIEEPNSPWWQEYRQHVKDKNQDNRGFIWAF